MNGRDVFGLVLVFAALVIAGLMVITSPVPTTADPTDAPSGERAEPCDLEHERACNELVDVQGGQR